MSKTSFLLHQTLDATLSDSSFFLTLTFAEDVSPKEASARFNSFRQWLMQYVKDYVCVTEATKRGRPHFHLVVTHRSLSGRGYPHADVARGIYYRVPKAIRKFWRKLRAALVAYGFGYRHDFQPVRGKGIAGYMAKYLAKSLDNRPPEWRGVRLLRMSRHISAGTVKFMWATPYMKAWRQAASSVFMITLPLELEMWHLRNRSTIKALADEIFQKNLDIPANDAYHPVSWTGSFLPCILSKPNSLKARVLME